MRWPKQFTQQTIKFKVLCKMYTEWVQCDHFGHHWIYPLQSNPLKLWIRWKILIEEHLTSLCSFMPNPRIVTHVSLPGQTYKNEEEWLYWHRKCLHYYFSFNLTSKKQEINCEIVKEIMEKCYLTTGLFPISSPKILIRISTNESSNFPSQKTLARYLTIRL